MLLDLFSVEYGPSTVVAPDTHDGADHHKKRHDYQAWLKHQKKLREQLEIREQEKLLRIKELRDQLKSAIKPKTDEIVEVIDSHSESHAPQQIRVVQDNTQEIRDELLELQKEILLISEQLKEAAIEYRKRKDERDIQAIIMLLQLPFS